MDNDNIPDLVDIFGDDSLLDLNYDDDRDYDRAMEMTRLDNTIDYTFSRE